MLELVLGGWYELVVELFGPGRSTHCSLLLDKVATKRRRRHLKPLISYTFAPNLGVRSLVEKNSTFLVLKGSERDAPPKKTKNWNFC